MNLEHIVLNGRNQPKKATYVRCCLYETSRQTAARSWGGGGGRQVTGKGDEKHSGTSHRQLHTTVNNALGATGLYTFEWLMVNFTLSEFLLMILP